MTSFMGGVDDAEGFSGAGPLGSFQFYLIFWTGEAHRPQGPLAP